MSKLVCISLIVSLACAGCVADEALAHDEDDAASTDEHVGEAPQPIAPIVIALAGAAIAAAAGAGATLWATQHQAPCPSCPPCPPVIVMPSLPCPPAYPPYPAEPYPVPSYP